MAEPVRTKSLRGFDGYDEFQDAYGAKVRVYQSSAYMEPCVWVSFEGGELARQTLVSKLGIKVTTLLSVHPSPDVEPTVNEAVAHLNRDQARRLRDALDTFLGETR
jgi:hypothetical protein